MITVIGLGFVGLTTALGFSKFGLKVYGIDNDCEKNRSIESCKIPFHEPYLEEVLKEQLNNNFFIDYSLKKAIQKSKAIFICVGTPTNNNGSADLSFIFNALKSIIDTSPTGHKTIVIKSTVPPGTIKEKLIPYIKNYSQNYTKYSIASNPEFLREGYSWEDFIKPDRIVLGVQDQIAKEILSEIYSRFNSPLHFVSHTTAEFIKYLSNTLLSTLISFSNEMSMIADKIGDIDIQNAFNILHKDKRWHGSPAIMSKYIYPGCGYGGYCLPKDTAALAFAAKQHKAYSKILDANIEVNNDIKIHIIDKIKNTIKTNEKIGFIGLSFKPGSDDVRESPSYFIIEKLLKRGYKSIHAFDPLANSNFDRSYKLPINYSESLDELSILVDHLIILTSDQSLKENKILQNFKSVLDFRNILPTGTKIDKVI